MRTLQERAFEAWKQAQEGRALAEAGRQERLLSDLRRRLRQQFELDDEEASTIMDDGNGRLACDCLYFRLAESRGTVQVLLQCTCGDSHWHTVYDLIDLGRLLDDAPCPVERARAAEKLSRHRATAAERAVNALAEALGLEVGL